MDRTRVLQILEANVGGARKHVHQILCGLERERFAFHLACSLDRDPGGASELEALRETGIEATAIPMRRRPSPCSDLAALVRLRRLVREGHFDLVHTHAAKAGFLGRLAARSAGVPAVLHTPHTFPFERVDTSLAPLYRMLERKAAKWCDRIVLVAPSQREVALRAGLCDEERLVVVENGITPPADPPEALRRRYREELGLGEGTPAVAFVARLTPQKDVQTFLSMAAELCRELPELRAFVVGRAGRPRYLRSLRPRPGAEAWRVLVDGAPAGEGVPWSASLPARVLGERRDAAELVAAFDLVILPSRYEGLPYSLLEAMACRVPVVASDVTGNRDVIEHGRSGWLAEAGDVAGFGRGVRALLADDGRRREVGAAARERVLASFTEERFLRGMTRLYDSMLRGSVPRGEPEDAADEQAPD
jgi:glycosyltransferase involved in cell wall biosynthesis